MLLDPKSTTTTDDGRATELKLSGEGAATSQPASQPARGGVGKGGRGGGGSRRRRRRREGEGGGGRRKEEEGG